MTIHFIDHKPDLRSVTVFEAGEDATKAAIAAFLSAHPSAEFGPAHPAAGRWAAHGTFNPQDIATND